MDSVPLDISVMDFIPLGTFSRSYNAPSVPVPFPQTFAISNVPVPSWFAPLFAEPHALSASYSPCRDLMVRLQ